MVNFFWVAFGFITIIFGFIFGINWDSIAKNSNYEIKLGDFFTLFGAAIGVFGAYAMATSQERRDRASKIERINYLSTTFFTCYSSACTSKQLHHNFTSSLESAEACLIKLENLPIEQIPAEKISVYTIYLRNARASFEMLKMQCNNPGHSQKLIDLLDLNRKILSKTQDEIEKHFN